MDFKYIELKEISCQVLKGLFEHDHIKAEDLAAKIGLETRQVDAAVTKSLVRYGFAKRMCYTTPITRKQFNILIITDRGIEYCKYLQTKEEANGNSNQEIF